MIIVNQCRLFKLPVCHCERSEAIQILCYARFPGLLRHFVPRKDGQIILSLLPSIVNRTDYERISLQSDRIVAIEDGRITRNEVIQP